MTPSDASSLRIAERIRTLRGARVMLDSDLAALYGVPVKRLNEQVRRNLARFPQDFAFILDDHEFAVLKSQIATSSKLGRQAQAAQGHYRARHDHGGDGPEFAPGIGFLPPDQ
jgi:hypothetical protein